MTVTRDGRIDCEASTFAEQLFLWLDGQSAGTKRSLLRIVWHEQISELVGSDNLLHILKEGAPGPGALLSNEFAP